MSIYKMSVYDGDYDTYAAYHDHEDYTACDPYEGHKFDYIIDGIEVDLIGEAYQTNRCLYNPDGNLFEMQALARDRDHKRYFVRWIFEDNGEESFDAYDYSEPYECVLIDNN